MTFNSKSRTVAFSGGKPPFTNFEELKMNGHVKAYAVFLAFYIVTKVIAAPVVNKMNLPIVGNSL